MTSPLKMMLFQHLLVSLNRERMCIQIIVKKHFLLLKTHTKYKITPLNNIIFSFMLFLAVGMAVVLNIKKNSNTHNSHLVGSGLVQH